MVGEYTANIETFVSTVLVDNWKGTGKTVRTNTSDYVPERDGNILEGPTQPPRAPGVSDLPNFDPHYDEQGRWIAGLASPQLRA